MNLYDINGIWMWPSLLINYLNLFELLLGERGTIMVKPPIFLRLRHTISQLSSNSDTVFFFFPVNIEKVCVNNHGKVSVNIWHLCVNFLEGSCP